MTSAADISAAADRLLLHGDAAHALGLEHRASSIAAVAAELVSHAARADRGEPDVVVPSLADSAELSVPMTTWALRTTLHHYVAADLVALARGHLERKGGYPVPARLVSVVLAGNVFTAAWRAIVLPLLVGAPVLAKASSRDDTLPRLMKTLFSRIDPTLAQALEVVSYAGGNDDLDGALLAPAEVVSIYGSANTVSSLRARTPPHARVVAHGHGLGLGLVLPEALSDTADLDMLAHSIAIDVATYDGRGCLSPHAILVPRGASVTPEVLARRVAAAGLDPIGRLLPRGPLNPMTLASQSQWRAVAVARGFLHEGDDSAISVEPTVRHSPGYRNVALVPYDDPADVTRALQPFAAHLKIVGVAGRSDALARAKALLPRGFAPRITPIGLMQDPSLFAYDDGLPPLESLVRFVELAG